MFVPPLPVFLESCFRLTLTNRSPPLSCRQGYLKKQGLVGNARLWRHAVEAGLMEDFLPEPANEEPASAADSDTQTQMAQRTLLRRIWTLSLRELVQDAADFTDRVLRSAQPVLVDFHAQWCGPCKILGPRLEKMVSKQQGKVTMAKVDIDDHTDLAIEYGVSAVPTVLAIKNGDVVDKFVGIKDEDQLDAFISKLIGS
ncbi:thioredoxin, mitochondrial [Acipenser oxyrinchus oxyrinchus]|uniref:Thioredoxin, mitochondrial n=1 Tax=Acipenser oxyrinchus oxyrinchus TaxID=40147 RepID=A0AAD8FVZ6_ACIOX|nr:thioredoxin, mitochondrial [Acipenser oxyrinchus oxyrinchus]